MALDKWLDARWPGSRTLMWIAGIAIVVKVLVLFVLLPWLQAASPGNYEADKFQDWYDLLARNIAEGNGYRFFPDTTATMLRTPAWPLVLAGLFSLFGYGIASVKVFNLLCSIGTAALTFALCERICNRRPLALLAALIAFFHPAIVIADSRGGVESFFMLFLMLFAWLAYRALNDGRYSSYALAGVAMGVLLLTKSTAVLFAPCIFLYLVVRDWSVAGVRRAVLNMATLTVVASLMLAPWIVRNYMLSGEFVPTMSVGGMSAYSGYYMSSHRDSGREQYQLDIEASNEMGEVADAMGLPHRPGYYTQLYTPADELLFYRQLGKIVRDKYRNEPGLFRRALVDNAVGFWVRGRTLKATTMNALLVLPFLALTIVGAWMGSRRRLPVMPIVLMIGAFYLVHIPILGQARYHVPLIPIMAVLLVLVLLPWVRNEPESG